MTERDIFLAALDHNDSADRADYLDRACGGNTPLRGRVEALLRADAASEGFLRPPVAVATAVPPATAGPFELGEEVGRGGMGVVYRARDARLDRNVAVKLLHGRAAADPAAAARFRHEARVTARLAHPGVPPVHEVGELPDGRPYLAMKLVEGRTLADLLRDRPDPTAERGRLVPAFEAVCQAVAFAHSRGVIHRDLKPANVMVGAFGEVQVMDWGLAKVLADADALPPSVPPQLPAHVGPDETVAYWAAGDHTPAEAEGESGGTRAGLVLGTPGYMAPEQARGGPADRRADVFGLGAVLCDLLTGGPPFAGTTPIDTLRANATGDPASARDRLARCGADPELVALCERCLHPDPAARPADAGVVAAEVAALRVRADERAQRAEVDRAAAEVRATEERKRRRTRTVLGSAVAVVLAAGAGVSGWLAVLAHRAEGETREQLVKTQEAEAAAVRSAGEASATAELARRKEWEAKESAADANAYAYFLAGGFLQAASPSHLLGGFGSDPKLSETMAMAEAALPKHFDGRPLAESLARSQFGITWHKLGQYQRAERQFRRAIELQEQAGGPDDFRTVALSHELGITLSARGHHRAAVPLLRQALAGYERVLGEDQQGTLVVAVHLGNALAKLAGRAEAERLYRRALAGQEKIFGPDHDVTLATVYHLAEVIDIGGDRAGADALYRRALDGIETRCGSDHPGTLAVIHGMAASAHRRGETAAAEERYQRALAGRERALGPTHPETLDTAFALAEMAFERKDDREAARLFERVYEGRRAYFGPDHEFTLMAARCSANMSWRLGQRDRALPLFADTARRLTATGGVDSVEALDLTWTTGLYFFLAGRASEAVPFLERGYAARHWFPLPGWAPETLSLAYVQTGRPAEAVRVLTEHLTARRATMTPNDLSFFLFSLGRVLTDTDPAAAEPVLRECLTLREKHQPGTVGLYQTVTLLGAALTGQKRYADAEKLLLQAHHELKQLMDPPTKTTYGEAAMNMPYTVNRLVALYAAWQKPDEVREWQAERAKYPREVLPPPRPDSAK